MNKSVTDIVARCRHNWPAIMAMLDIPVQPDGRHSACPACGGKDRFRFDNKAGGGTIGRTPGVGSVNTACQRKNR